MINALLAASLVLFVVIVIGMLIRIYSHRRHQEDKLVPHAVNNIKVPHTSKHVVWRIVVLILMLALTLVFGICFGYTLDLSFFGMSDVCAAWYDFLLGIAGILVWGAIILAFYLVLSLGMDLIRLVLSIYSWCFGGNFHKSWRDWSAVFFMDNQPDLNLHHKHYFLR